MPPLAGRRDDRQPKIRPCPQPIRFTVETLHHNHITAPMLTDSDSHRACAEPLGPRHQGRSSSLRCGRSTLTPGPVQRCPHRGRNSSKPPLTTPCPFRDDYHRGDYVFTFEDGRPPHPDTIRQRFDRLAAAAGLSRITFHDLRHSYATGALKAGVSPKVISERIGHANVGFFLQTYAHVLGSDDREAAEQAAAFLIGGPWDASNDKTE